jgi:putative toxin-antitoxin system antitoxin component (TIGR02293 family)
MYPVAIEKVAKAMGGPSILGRRVASIADLQRAIVDGLPKRVVGAIEATAVPKGSDVHVLDLVTSLATYKRSDRLSPQAGERAERLARVSALAIEIFEDDDDARRWLTTPHPLLGARAPLATASSDLGAREVERILQNIDHGLPV